ncbi:MAG: helix-turn-helix domain-containing protein [Opitutales bacterium]
MSKQPKRYQDIYPESPLLNSEDLERPSAKSLLRLEFFEAAPGQMPQEVFNQHHILFNLRDSPHRLENWRDGVHRDFMYRKDEVIVTPAGVRSGWRWHDRSKCIVITLEPTQLESFAQHELGTLLTDTQLKDTPQFVDPDLTQAAIMLRDALTSELGSAVMFESFARVFLTKLIQRYGLECDETLAFNQSFTSKHYQKVLDYVAAHFHENLTLEKLSSRAGFSPFHFTRLFKRTIGHTPHQFVMRYRVEQSRKMLLEAQRPIIDIAVSCGFSDQAHFSRVFKRLTGQTPRQYRVSLQTTA